MAVVKWWGRPTGHEPATFGAADRPFGPPHRTAGSGWRVGTGSSSCRCRAWPRVSWSSPWPSQRWPPAVDRW